MSIAKYKKNASEPYGESVSDFNRHREVQNSKLDDKILLQKNEEKIFYTKECIVCHTIFNTTEDKRESCSKECRDKLKSG